MEVSQLNFNLRQKIGNVVRKLELRDIQTTYKRIVVKRKNYPIEVNKDGQTQNSEEICVNK